MSGRGVVVLFVRRYETFNLNGIVVLIVLSFSVRTQLLHADTKIGNPRENMQQEVTPSMQQEIN